MIKTQKIDEVERLLKKGAVPVYFDAAGMTALYFIDCIEILDLFMETFLDLFRWQDWWGRYVYSLFFYHNLNFKIPYRILHSLSTSTTRKDPSKF